MQERKIVVVRHAPGYRTLVRRLTLAFQKRASNERNGYKVALIAISEFLRETKNIAFGAWLIELAWALDDLDRGVTPSVLRPAGTGNKSISSREWRRFAAVSLGMKALTMCNVSRSDAADRALRAVKVIRGTKKAVILGRYDEFGKKRIKNRDAAGVYAKGCKLLDGQSPDKLCELAKGFFFYANTT
jgi:hypothetical protein